FLIRSCILLFYIPALAAQSAPPSREARFGEAEQLYQDRANLASARRAAEMWAAALAADPRDFEAAWKLARADYWLGGHAADRALGRWYFKVPGLFGGSDKQAEAHLRASLKYNPNSTSSHFFLAEVLIDAGRKNDARAELQKVLDAPLDPNWTPEDREFKQKADRLLRG